MGDLPVKMNEQTEHVVNRVAKSWPLGLRDDLRQEARMALLMAPEPNDLYDHRQQMSWMQTIARNAMRRWRRDTTFKVAQLVGTPVARQETSYWMELMDHLPYYEHTVLDLHYRCGYNLTAIAKLLNTDRSVVRGWLQAGKRRCRILLR